MTTLDNLTAPVPAYATEVDWSAELPYLTPGTVLYEDIVRLADSFSPTSWSVKL